MATLTIRKIEDEIKKRLRLQAAKHERSMEEEARVILTNALREDAAQDRGLGSRIHSRFALHGGVDLEIPKRTELPHSAHME